jgi:nuclear pore complex protein Nup93
MSLLGQSSLFANLVTPSTSAPASQPAQTGGLGGQANQAPSSSLFGGLGPLQPQSTAPSGGGLWGLGQPASSQPQQPSSSFLAQNNAAANQPFGPSLLAPQQPSQNQNGQPQDVNGQQSLGLAKASQPAYFNSLLEKGKKRAHAADGGPAFGDLPTLQLGLEDIARRARELAGLGSQDRGPSTDGKASEQR